jgi:uncharacterized protein (TIGR03435 family)
MRWIALAGFLLGVAAGQDAGPPSFEVASVKPSSPEGGRMGIGLFTYPGGRVVASNYRLRMLVHDAYGVEMYQVIGGPAWTDTDRFNIEAKAPAGSEASRYVPATFKSPPNADERLMLRRLLAERFHLRVHTETRKEQVYALVVAKGGPKLKEPESRIEEPFVSFLPRGYRGRNATIDQLVYRLAQSLKRPVANETGIQGNFDFTIEWQEDDAGTDDNVLLLGALQQQVGLKLEARAGDVEVVVIDHAEKPVAN